MNYAPCFMNFLYRFSFFLQTTGDFHFGAEDIGEDEYATVQKSPVVMEIKDDKEPHSVRNYESVMNLPEESPGRPANRTSQHSHIGLIMSGEMVEIPLQDEKCELLPIP